MASLFGTLNLWTLKENLAAVKDGDIGCTVYHEKSDNALLHDGYASEKRNFVESRGSTWFVSNKRPEKLKDNLKELEELCLIARCIHLEWKTQQVMQAIFNTGVIVYFFLNGSTGDLEKISFDKHLIGKLYSEHVVDVIQVDTSLIFSYVEPKLTHVQLNRKPGLVDSGRKWEKLSSLSPKITHTELIGPSGRRLERRLSCNVKHNLLMLWWRISNDEIWPWTPLSTEKERANIHLYSINGSKFELVSYCRTEVEPLIASFSKLRPHQILTLEQKILPNGDVFVDRCVYEITLTKLQRVALASIPLKSHVISQEQNNQEDKVLIACGDNNLVMYDDYRRTTQSTKLSFVPTVISWHPNGCVVLVSSNKGEILCFDQALSSIKFKLLKEDIDASTCINISEYFSVQPIMSKIVWNNSNIVSPDTSYFMTSENIGIYLERGPFARLQIHLGVLNRGSLTPVEIISEYIKYQQIDEAVNLLSSLNWNLEGRACYFILTVIVNHLLCMPLNDDREVQLEAALGTFYAPIRPLSKISILEYRDRIRNLARRFFHLLLRSHRLEKAALLAVNIGSSDLFRDLFHIATERGEHGIADMAMRNIEGLDSIATETDTGDSQDYDSANESSDYSYSSECSEDNLPKSKANEVAASNLSCAAMPNGQDKALRKPLVARQATVQRISQAISAPIISIEAAGTSKGTATNMTSSTVPVAPQRARPSASTPVNVDEFSRPKLMPKPFRPPPSPNMVKETERRTHAENFDANFSGISVVAGGDSIGLAHQLRRMRMNANERSHEKSQEYYQPVPPMRQVPTSQQQPLDARTRLLDPNEQYVDSDPSSVESDDEEPSGTVKVVHFGVV